MIDELLDQLVAQFSSPYDFLRELVQNAMDAGSDCVDVRLHVHRDALGDRDVVFELEIVDAGSGMDEAVIDGELTRLFASKKTGDHTMVGGFGIGFVSVFAWQPQTVLLQTGRRDESWELRFDAARSFKKYPVDQPLEGTTLRLFRRGLASEHEVIAEAVRDALWRWCRYCPIDVSFEDVEGVRGLEDIAEDAVPAQALVRRQVRHGETTLRVAFCPEGHVTLLRHGLVLAEGTPAEHLLYVRERLAASLAHLDVWVDSPKLRTTMARDSVVDDAGRRAIEDELVGMVEALRVDLVEALGVIAGTQAWDIRCHGNYRHHHEHLRCELSAVASTAGFAQRVRRSPIVRTPGGSAMSTRGLAQRARFGVVAVVDPLGDGQADPASLGLRVGALRAGIPVVSGQWLDDQGWLRELLALDELEVKPLETVLRARPTETDSRAVLGRMVQAVLAQAGLKLGALGLCDLGDSDLLRPVELCAVEVKPELLAFAITVPAQRLQHCPCWLNARHPLVEQAQRCIAENAAGVAVLAVAQAVADKLAVASVPVQAVADAWNEARQ